MAFSRWDTIYAEAADGLNVIPDLGHAVAWANDLVGRIDTASGQATGGDVDPGRAAG